jgi:hypothetical protein
VTERKISPHALEQAARRGVDEATLARIAGEPEQVVAVRPAREVRQSRIAGAEGKTYLVRVFVDIAAGLETVVTVYKTSKIAKYWRQP